MALIRPRYSQADQVGTPSRSMLEKVERQTSRNIREWSYAGNPLGQGMQSQWAPMMPLMKAVVTSAIGPCTRSVNGNTNAVTYTYGTGNCQLYYSDSPDATTATADPDSSGNTNAPWVPVLNWYCNSGTINTNTSIWVTPIDSAVWLIGADC